MTENKDKLNIRQEAFCQLYAGSGEYFGNATISYAIAFNISIPHPGNTKESLKVFDKANNICAASSSRLLRLVKILNRCDEVLREKLTDNEADTELSYVIKQRGDLKSKIRAIGEFNKLKGRIIEKREVEHDFKNLDDDKLRRIITGGTNNKSESESGTGPETPGEPNKILQHDRPEDTKEAQEGGAVSPDEGKDKAV